jgi:predicted ATP-grasp superfamily ATP-dependent carboligase
MRLMITALNNGWDISDEVKAAVLALPLKVLSDPEASVRDKLRAAELVDSLMRTNVAVEGLDLQAKKIEQSRPDFAPTVVDIMREVERAEAGMARKGETDGKSGQAGGGEQA